MTDLYSLLEQHGISYTRIDHPPVYTCEEAEALVPDLPGAHTKNLFVRDGKGRRHFLVAVGWEKQVDLKALARVLGVGKLSMASPERLRRHLGVEPGAVTLLGVVHDADGAVEVVVDEAVWQEEMRQCHPLVNTTTLAVPRTGLEGLFAALGTRWRVVEVPSRT